MVAVKVTSTPDKGVVLLARGQQFIPPVLPAVGLDATELNEELAQGTLIGNFTVPEGSSIALTDSANGSFQLNGTRLEAGPTLIDLDNLNKNFLMIEITQSRQGYQSRIQKFRMTIRNVLEVVLNPPTIDNSTIFRTSQVGDIVGQFNSAGSLRITNTNVLVINSNNQLVVAKSLLNQPDSLELIIETTHPDAATRIDSLFLGLVNEDNVVPIIQNDDNYNVIENQLLEIELVANEAVSWTLDSFTNLDISINDNMITVNPANYENVTSGTFTVTATDLSGNSSSKTVTVAILNEFEQPSLQQLTLSQSGPLPINTPLDISIGNTTAGSTLAAVIPVGLTLDSNARRITGTVTTAQSFDIEITESLADSENSPRKTVFSVVFNNPLPDAVFEVQTTPEDSASTFVSAEMFFVSVMPNFVVTVNTTPENSNSNFVSGEINAA